MDNNEPKGGKTIHLRLLRQYYDAIAKGTKKKEYRGGNEHNMEYYNKVFSSKIKTIIFHCQSSKMEVEVTGVVLDKRQNMYVIGLGIIISSSDMEEQKGKE